LRVFVGDTRSHKLVARLKERGWGRMCCRDRPAPYPGEAWGQDNGAFGAWLKGETLDLERFRDVAARAADIGGCALAVLPDIVTGGMASLDCSMRELDRLPELPWYLAVQDDMEFQPNWGTVCHALEDPRIAGIFIGGSNRFKTSAPTWSVTAGMLGKSLHYGRAGTPHKVAHAMRSKVDSIDSAFPLWTKERWELFELAIDNRLPQLTFDLVVDEFDGPRTLELQEAA